MGQAATEELRCAFPAAFFEDTWQREPRALGRVFKEFAAQFFPTSKNGHLEGLLRSAPSPASGCPAHLLTRRDGETVDRGRYASWSHAYADGASMIVNRADYLDERVLRSCRVVAATLGAPHCYANLYATPAKARAVKAHADDRDVFIAQVEGAKRWKVWLEPPVPFPYPHEQVGKDDRPVPPLGDDDDKCLEVLLEAGDCLYLPRGFVHEARSDKEHSVHLTYAFATHDWSYAVLAAALVRETLDRNKRWRMAPPFVVEAIAETKSSSNNEGSSSSSFSAKTTKDETKSDRSPLRHEPTYEALRQRDDDVADLRAAVLEALTPTNLATQLGARVASQFDQDDDVVAKLRRQGLERGLSFQTRLRRRPQDDPHPAPPDVLRASAQVVRRTAKVRAALDAVLEAVDDAEKSKGLAIADFPPTDDADDLRQLCLADIGLVLGDLQIVTTTG